MARLALLALALHLSASWAQLLPDPLICEDSLNNEPPFNANRVPCLLGCGLPEPRATGRT